MSLLATGDVETGKDAVKAARVLVAEQDEPSADILQAFLKEAGFVDIVTTVGPSAVMDLIFEVQPDLLLLDSGTILGGDGVDLLESLRANRSYRQLPVVVLAASPDRDLKLRLLEQGVVDILPKPVDPAELALRLRNILLIKVHRDRAVYHDDLTGLPNRERYADHLDWAIKYAQRYKAFGAVLHIDLDRFKHMVSALGWGMGDRMLRAAAKNISTCVRSIDLVAKADDHAHSVMLSRVSGNEFTVLLSVIDQPDSAAVVAGRILSVIQTPFQAAGRDFITTCSIGIAIFPDDGNTRDEIMHAAGMALQHAKRDGGNGFHFYSPDLNDRAMHRLGMEADLRRALEQDELRLVYQPKVSIGSGSIAGAEALVRWMHPTRGMVSPAEFIPLAEETNLIVPLGDWVLKEACRQINAWKVAGLAVPRVAVNISLHQFRQRAFVDRLVAILASNDLEGQYLGLEFTESAIMDNTDASMQALDALKALGLELSIDDFGTGYSSLSYLKRFPLHELKIDRSFLMGIGSDEHSAAIVSTILSMGHRLGLKVVAEGVETQEQLDFLAGLECDEYQGFFFSKPVPPDEFAALLGDCR